MWIRGGHGGTRNLSQSGSNEQGEDLRLKRIFRPKSEIQAVFPAKNRWFKKKRSSSILRGIFWPKSKIQAVFAAKNKCSTKSNKKNVMKSVVSPQKTPIWDSICAPEAPNLLISSGHSPRLGGLNFRFGGTSSNLRGHGPGMPPRGAGSDLAGKDLRKFQSACGPTQCKSGPGNKMVYSVAIYSTFFNNNSPPPRQFSCNKILLKTIISYSKRNTHWTNFWIERAWAYMYSYNRLVS